MEVDVVIPTTRLLLERLALLLQIHESALQARVTYYIVVDRPGADLAPLRELVRDRDDVVLLHNQAVLGAHGTRNRGVDAGRSELILFLDDDVTPAPWLLSEYLAAIRADPFSPGYVGVTRFPPSHDDFTAGVRASDILTFFDLAEKQPQMPWGVTANLCLRRSALGTDRFSDVFPKAGGGEDIDLCLRIGRRLGRPLVTVPNAWVEHPWWREARGSYRRFFRWAFGDSRLPMLHPEHRYRNAPSLPESLFIVGGLWLVLPGFPALLALMAVPVLVFVEVVVEHVKLRRRGSRLPFRVSCESVLVRLSNDLGRFVGHVSRGRIGGIFERFDYFCDGLHIGDERRVAFGKLFLSAGVLTVLGLAL